MATPSYATADTALREVADAVTQAVGRVTQAKATITTEKTRLEGLGAKHEAIVTWINDHAQEYPDLKTRLDALAADFNARIINAGAMESALEELEI